MNGEYPEQTEQMFSYTDSVIGYYVFTENKQ